MVGARREKCAKREREGKKKGRRRRAEEMAMAAEARAPAAWALVWRGQRELCASARSSPDIPRGGCDVSDPDRALIDAVPSSCALADDAASAVGGRMLASRSPPPVAGAAVLGVAACSNREEAALSAIKSAAGADLGVRRTGTCGCALRRAGRSTGRHNGTKDEKRARLNSLYSSGSKKKTR